MIRCSLSAQRGQTAAEYLGLLLVVAALVGILAGSDIGDRLSGAVRDAVCRVSGSCDAGARAGRDTGSPRPGDAGRNAGSRREREQQALLNEADGGADRTPAAVELEQDLLRERLIAPIDLTLTPAERDRRALQEVLDDRARQRGEPVPTPLDPDGDGVDDIQVSTPQPEGGMGDRFGGELCGLSKAVLFGSEVACGAGDETSRGYQQGEELASAAGTVLSPAKVTKVTKIPKAIRGARSAPAPKPPTPAAAPAPSAPRAPPRLREGNRRTRTERNSRDQPDRLAGRPDPDRRQVIGRGDKGDSQIDKHRRPGEDRLDLPASFDKGRGRLRDPKATWKQNAGQLREAMRSRKPIRDLADPGDRRGPWLNAERELLRNAGWRRVGRYWFPPARTR